MVYQAIHHPGIYTYCTTLGILLLYHSARHSHLSVRFLLNPAYSQGVTGMSGSVKRAEANGKGSRKWTLFPPSFSLLMPFWVGV